MDLQVKTKQPGLSKRSLSAHSWLGLVVSALMYIICLSGTVAVFHQELERWEQPDVVESSDFTLPQLASAYSTFVQTYKEETGHMHIVFPSSGIPRVVVENDHVAHFVNPDGSLGQVEKPLWTKMLVELHLFLHLPKNVGMILVSAFGALLCALIISGFLAHPRIVKDAFRLRRGGTGMQENIDLHNRFSVWGAPFHLMIAVTGAYFALASVVIVVISQAFYDGDNQAVVDRVFAAEPELQQPLQSPDIVRAIEDVQVRSPDGQLIFLTVHEPDTAGQFIEIYVKQPGRLIYSENFRYDIAGNFLEKGGYQDGEAGKQIIYSLYRLHFGDFAGLGSKLLYFVLGLMLTVISATGINIWLAKRKSRDFLNFVWPAIVWGAPFALVLSAFVNLYVDARVDYVVWLALVATSGVALRYQNTEKLKRDLKRLLAASSVLFVAAYGIQFGTSAFTLAALQINLPLIAFAGYLLYKQPSKVASDQAKQVTVTS